MDILHGRNNTKGHETIFQEEGILRSSISLLPLKVDSISEGGKGANAKSQRDFP